MNTCWECRGPCLTYRGSVHGWRCSTCINKYLAAAAARADAKVHKHREKLARNSFQSNDNSSRLAK